MVAPLMSATMPLRIASEAISEVEKRDSGTPLSRGNSQASALTLTTISGGKNGRSSGSGTILQSEQTEFKEPLAPSADDLPRDVQLQADGLVVDALSGEQYDLSTDHLIIRCRISP